LIQINAACAAVVPVIFLFEIEIFQFSANDNRPMGRIKGETALGGIPQKPVF
jgi:hypothetical protein